MGINRQSDESANLQVGPTTEGMVRIYVASETLDLPMDFTPDDAEEIARELFAAAETARGKPAGPVQQAVQKERPRPGNSGSPQRQCSRGGTRQRRRESAARDPR